MVATALGVIGEPRLDQVGEAPAPAELPPLSPHTYQYHARPRPGVSTACSPARFSLADTPLCMSQTKMQQLGVWRQAATERGWRQAEFEGVDEEVTEGRARYKMASNSERTAQAAAVAAMF
jgi:hypothetical protein